MAAAGGSMEQRRGHRVAAAWRLHGSDMAVASQWRGGVPWMLNGKDMRLPWPCNCHACLSAHAC
eukprot:3369497-Lingulodinium_polyedra.AAC.1